MIVDNLLYIGLNGLAGSGKDTVAKMLNIILMKKWDSYEDCKEFYQKFYIKPNCSATYYEKYKNDKTQVICLAFADQLKNICSNIFGIPLKYFYFNKSTAWVCINHNFEYTEIRPNNVVSCEDYFYNISKYKDSETEYWMSLRDVLVYIGTYVLQSEVNKNVFVNIIKNKIENALFDKLNLKYAIITDVRFIHEFDFIRKKNGITIKIIRDSINALPNIAEHDLDDEDSYDFIIYNNSTYEDLFKEIWDLVHNNIEFENKIIQLNTRENINNYLRQIDENKYQVCSPYGIQQIGHEDGEISMIDLKGGPTIYINQKIENTNIIPYFIEMDDITNKFVLYI